MRWAANFSQIFIDFVVYTNASLKDLLILLPLILFLFILVIYSLYFLCCQTPKQVWLFVLTLIGVPALALALPDLILGGYRSGTSRYLIPCYIGIQLAIAYLLATQIASISIKTSRQKLWQLVMTILVTGGILSCVISSQADFWWNKSTASFDNLQVGRIVNRTIHPLLLINTSPVDALSLSYLLTPKVQLEWWDGQLNSLFVDTIYDNTLLVDKTFDSLEKQELYKQHKYKIELLYKGRDKSLWKLEKL